MWVGDKQTGFGLQVTSATESTQGEFNFKVSDEYDVEKAGHPFEVKHGSKYVRLDYAHHAVGEIPDSDVEDPATILPTNKMCFEVPLEAIKLKIPCVEAKF
jgi:hypothetical protein